MTNDRRNDERLVSFLRANAPRVPSGCGDLERRVMREVARVSQRREERFRFRQWLAFATRPWSLAVASATAIALAAVILYPGTVLDPKVTLSEEAELDAFVAESWDGMMGTSTSSTEVALSEVLDEQ
jgi:hypothetical protein